MKDSRDRHTIDVFSGRISHGGRRKGAGRPRGEPTTTIRVPVSLLPEIRLILNSETGINKPDKRLLHVVEFWERLVGGRGEQPRWSNVVKLLRVLRELV